jgi:hypothetical protein
MTLKRRLKWQYDKACQNVTDFHCSKCDHVTGQTFLSGLYRDCQGGFVIADKARALDVRDQNYAQSILRCLGMSSLTHGAD